LAVRRAMQQVRHFWRRRETPALRLHKMPAYYIGEHIVSDFSLFDGYLAKVVPMIERFGGRYPTKAASHEILEGDWKPNRVVIIEFPDIASINNWYGAPEYQPLIALRRSAATDIMIMLEGL
jgi:uncharacterized protein (DUF1330 family)